jgi:hypothetical protein
MGWSGSTPWGGNQPTESPLGSALDRRRRAGKGRTASWLGARGNDEGRDRGKKVGADRAEHLREQKKVSLAARTRLAIAMSICLSLIMSKG